MFSVTSGYALQGRNAGCLTRFILLTFEPLFGII
jgi:hypothetical protein